MQRNSSDDDEPLEDTTAAIPLHSKRTERLQRKKATRNKETRRKTTLAELPVELILEVLELLRPSDAFSFSSVNRRSRDVVLSNSHVLGDKLIARRYDILSRCLPCPALLCTVEPRHQPLLTDEKRMAILGIHTKSYTHVQPPDPNLICTCLTCMLAWNNLGLVLDFAYWQDNLDNGVPIPTLPRGKTVPWNEALADRNARIVRRALQSPLWHARILETHLESIVRSIRRHQRNKGDRRRHIMITEEEAAAQTDHFLQKPGPSSLEFPFNRDEYYMLEGYLPNRWWKKFEQRWVYTMPGQHERDIDMLVAMSSKPTEATAGDGRPDK